MGGARASTKVEYIDSPADLLADARLADYRDVRDRDLLLARSLFVVEGRENVRRLLRESSFVPRSFLFSKPAFEALGGLLAERAGDVPVFVGSRAVLREVAGFDLHRGCLAMVERPAARDPRSVLPPAGTPSRVVVLEGLANPDNVGSVFRSAMALGADAVLVCPRCCDPFYRKSIRVSMGAALSVPWARFDDWPAGLDVLRAAGYRVVALDPGEGALEIGSAAWRRHADSLPRVALVVGSEGVGLASGTLARCDERQRVGMRPGVDSLNVATAVAVALHHLFLSGRD